MKINQTNPRMRTWVAISVVCAFIASPATLLERYQTEGRSVPSRK